MLLIDRIALYKVYMEALKRHPIPKEFGLKRCLAVAWVEAAGFFLTQLSQAPTIEAEPVRHGRWVKQWCDNNMIGHEYAECCICGCSMLDTNQFWNSKYCPNCGARMDGGADDGA